MRCPRYSERKLVCFQQLMRLAQVFANAALFYLQINASSPAGDSAALTRALRSSRSALRLSPGFGPSWGVMGTIVARTGRRQDAIWLLKRALFLHFDIGFHELLTKLDPTFWPSK